MCSKRVRWAVSALLLVVSLVLPACAAPEPEVVSEQVEVTRVVELETEVTRVVEVEVEPETTEEEEAQSEIQLPDVIRIGVLDALTGSHSPYGLGSVDGIKIANDEFPEVLGRPIELVMVDNQSDKAQTALAAARVVEEGVVGVLGCSSSNLSMAANEVFHEAGLPSVAPCSTNPLVTEDKPYAFRVCFIDPFAGRVMAKFAVEELGAETAVLFSDITRDYPVGLTNFFREAWLEMMPPESLLGYYSLMYGDTDFTAQLTAIKELNPDVIFAPNDYKEQALISKQAKELGITSTFLSGDGISPAEFIEIGGSAVNGTFYAGHFHPDAPLGERGESFVETYRALHDKEPDMLGALGYDAYIVLRDAIERAGSVDGEAIKQALSETENFEAVTGIITLDKEGNAVKSAVVIGFEDEQKYVAGMVEP